MPTRDEIENDNEIQQFVNEIESEDSHDDFYEGNPGDDDFFDVADDDDFDDDDFDDDDDDLIVDSFEKIGRNKRGQWYE